MVQRITSAVNWVTWLNTVTNNMFWTVCGVLCLWVVLFLYLKERFDTKASFVGSFCSMAFVTIFLYFLGLVSQILVFIMVVGAAASLVLL